MRQGKGRPPACVDCGMEFAGPRKGPAPQRCEACQRAHRTRSIHSWPSRVRRCPQCGATKRNSPGPCRGCATRRATVRCPVCHRDFWPWEGGSHPRRYCSRACAGAARRKPPQPKVRGQRRRRCLWCQTEYEPRWNQRACSPACRRRLNAQRKHLRRRGLRGGQVSISIRELYLRDRATCALCGKRVSLTYQAPDRRSATIDHIVPVSKGGQHVPENVQLAHYGCNSAKGTRRCGSQLRLFG